MAALSFADKIRMLLSARKVSPKEVSIKLGYGETYLYNKLNRNHLTEQDAIKIANALDCDFEGVFTMRDTGKTI